MLGDGILNDIVYLLMSQHICAAHALKPFPNSKLCSIKTMFQSPTITPLKPFNYE